MKSVAEWMEKWGIEVTSTWLKEKAPLDSQLFDAPDEENLACASVDLHDIDRADAIVLFSEDPLIGWPRGTHHVEFGYATGKGKKLIVIGGKENIMHFLPQVVHYSDVYTFLQKESPRAVAAH